MKEFGPVDQSPDSLRARAEAKARAVQLRPDQEREVDRASLEIREVVHELEVHQIELEPQNEELHRAEAEMQASRRRYAALFDHAPVGYFVIDGKDVVEHVNLAACSMLDCLPRTILGGLFMRLIDPRDRDAYYRLCRALGSGAGKQAAELRLLTRNTTPLPVRLECALGADDPSHIWCAAIDISKQWHNQQELRESERKFRAIANHSCDWEIWSGNDGIAYWISPAAMRFTGTVADQCRQMPDYPLAFVIEEDRPAVALALEGARRGGSGNNLAFRIRHADSSLRWGVMSWQPMADDDGTPLGFRTGIRDITELKAVEAALIEAKTAAELANAAKSRFLATVSHELRTPLNAIIGFTELLRASETDAKKQDQLHIVGEAGGNLLKLINDILDLSRIEAGRVDAEQEDFDLYRELGTVVSIFAVAAEQKGVRLQLSIADDVPRVVQGDSRSLRQILVNLIGNAVKFTPAGTVAVEVAVGGPVPPGDHHHNESVTVIFAVTDQGPGIRPENLERIFEMFEQEDPTVRRRFSGSGLGLAISKRLAGLLGGGIRVESTVGVGSRFILSVPLLPTTGGDRAVPEESAAPTAATGDQNSILVVEDDSASRRLMRQLLDDAGSHGILAEDGVEAMKVLGEQPVALVLMGVQLPKVSGVEVTRLVPSGAVPQCGPGVPIDGLTAFAMTSDRGNYLACRMADYLRKPLKICNLFKMIERFIKVGPCEVGLASEVG